MIMMSMIADSSEQGVQLMKVYSVKELERFCDRACTMEQADIAEKFIKSRPYLSEEEKNGLLLFLDGVRFAINDMLLMQKDMGYGDEYEEDDYSPSAPWGAPGMRVSDFITGVRRW